MSQEIEQINLNASVASVKRYLLDLQNRICQFIEIENVILETNTALPGFVEDKWQHPEGGGGLTRVLTGTHVIEKAGVNFSHVQGKSLPTAATLKRPQLANAPFQALGVSVVVHPLNPFVPTTHMNVRFVAVDTKEHGVIWWFGGGFDLTPYYGNEEDCLHWHQTAKQACLPFGEQVYPQYKKWCDQYFYLPHRKEPRGVGGIFYDDLNEWGFATCFAFMQSIGDHFIKAYQPILARRKGAMFTQAQREFQKYRRGRYVEFNLLYDRGTLFGLQSGGRTESILMSLPPIVNWEYNFTPAPHSQEAELYEKFLIPKDWVL